MQTFLQYYQREIQPRLAEIDVFLKTQPQPYTANTVARLLCLTAEEMGELLDQEQFGIITRGAFLHLMREGSSPVCRMFGREVACGMPKKYSPSQISYIYGLQQEAVEAAAERMGKEYFTSEELPALFSHIFISDKRCLL